MYSGGNRMDLQKGQKVRLSGLNQAALRVSAQMACGAPSFACFGVDNDGRFSDSRYLIFCEHKAAPENAVVMENLDGAVLFSFDFIRLPPFIRKLVVALEAGGDASICNVSKGKIALEGKKGDLAQYYFSGAGYQMEKALVLCELYENEGIWRLSITDDVFEGGLRDMLAFFAKREIQQADT